MKKSLVLFLVMVVCSCGFKPLYVERTTNEKWYFQSQFDGTINHEMEQVKVESINGRFGQLLRNDLLDMLTPSGIPSNPKYKLYVMLESEDVARQALRRDITATRERVAYKVVYYMMEGTNELFRNDSVAYVSYDILANPYSTTMAQKDAQENAAKIIAQDIALRIGAYFHLDKDMSEK